MGEFPAPPEKYPLYPVIPILQKPPAVYFALKRIPDAEPPQFDRPKPHPRAVNPETLSARHRPLYERSPFEQDLIILGQRDAIRGEANRQLSATHVSFCPPSMYFRGELERKQKLADQEMEYEAEVAKPRRYLQIGTGEPQHQEIESKSRKTETPIMREEYPERMKIRPERNTRSSSRRMNETRNEAENRELNWRRAALADEIQREEQRHRLKRCRSAITEPNPVDEGEIAKVRRDELRQSTQDWYQWLKLTQRKNERCVTMLERLFLV
jgi:hypothetical protein